MKILWYTPWQYDRVDAASAHPYYTLMAITGMRGAAGGRKPDASKIRSYYYPFRNLPGSF